MSALRLLSTNPVFPKIFGRICAASEILCGLGGRGTELISLIDELKPYAGCLTVMQEQFWWSLESGQKGRYQIRCLMKFRKIGLTLLSILFLGQAALASNIYTPHSRHKRLGVLDTVAGAFTDVGSFELPESVLIPAMAVDIDGTLYGLANRKGTPSGLSQLVVIDRATAQVTPVGFPNAINLLAFDIGPDGTAYAGGFDAPPGGWIGDPNLYRIDKATGELTLIGDTGVDKLMDFAFDSLGTMWATVADELYVIDTNTGMAEHAVTITGVDTVMTDPAAEIMGIMFDENDVLYATAFSSVESSPLFTIDTATGQATVVARPEMSVPHGGAYEAGGAVVRVKGDAAGAGDGSTWTDAYNNLRDALAGARPGDQIWVAAGTYTPRGFGGRTATFQLKSGVSIYGGFAGTEAILHQRDSAGHKTVLSGDLNQDDAAVVEPSDLAAEPTRSDNSYHVVTGSGSDETAVLDGFVITGGNANGSGHHDGAGMINVWSATGGRNGDGTMPARPTLAHCTFEWNLASRRGGGMFNSGGTPSLIHCTFRNNHVVGSSAPEYGGAGLYNLDASPAVTDCTFSRNTTGARGAGMYNWDASPTIIHCSFEDNSVLSNAANSMGGGLLNRGASHANVYNSVFTGNIAGYGGGIMNLFGARPTIVNCLLSRNQGVYPGDAAGGGLQNWGGGTNPTVINCTFSKNTAVRQAGLSANGGSTAVVSNCIFWGNRAGNRTDASAQIGGPTVVTYSCVQGGKSGEGNIDIDPLLVEADGPDNIAGTADDDLSLRAYSPCIDAGDDSALPIDIADLDGDGDVLEPIPFDLHGNRRISGFSVDIGAYEAAAVDLLAGNIYTPHNRHKHLAVLDAVTGVFTDVGSFGLLDSVLIPAMAFGIDGTLYGLANRKGSETTSGVSQLVVVDRATAQVTPVGFPNAINLMAFDTGPDGTTYVGGFNKPAGGWIGNSNLYRIDTGTGVLTLIGDIGLDHLMDFAFDSAGTMWATAENELHVIDTNTGSAQHAATITGLDAVMIDPKAEVMGIMFDENDVLYATALSLSPEHILVENSPVFIIDTVTGQATVVAEPELSLAHGGDIFVDPR